MPSAIRTVMDALEWAFTNPDESIVELTSLTPDQLNAVVKMIDSPYWQRKFGVGG